MPSPSRLSARVIVALALGAGSLAAGPAGPAGSAPAAGSALVHTISHDGRTLTLRLQPVSVRAPQFTVRLQGGDGSFTTVAAGDEHAYLGSVDGDPGAVAAAIVTHDGEVEGQVTFDRGETWAFEGDDVTRDDGADPTTAFHWPSSSDPSLNATVAPGQVGRRTYRFDIGFDLDSTLFDDVLGGSVPDAVDTVERLTVQLLAAYEGNARLRPAIARIVLRGDAGRSPYAAVDDNQKLEALADSWLATQSDAAYDDLTLLHDDPDTEVGGLASLGSAGTDRPESLAGWFNGFDDLYAIDRHELGHTWNVDDNHTNGPEGPTINSGNQYGRFDGTELRSILRHRDNRQAGSHFLTPVTAASIQLPPYAALDMRDGVVAGTTTQLLPLANDSDANGDRVTLTSVAGRSHLGGTLARSGDVVSYRAPQVTRKDTEDWFSYVVSDAAGRRATGEVIVRVDPTGPVDPDRWPRFDPQRHFALDVTNLQSGLVAGTVPSKPGSATLVQRPPGDDGGRFRFASAPGGTWRAINDRTGRCLTWGRGVAVQRPCQGVAEQRWSLRVNPAGGTALVNGRGRCLSTAGGSIRSGARLVATTCSRALSQRWTVAVRSADQWQPVTLSGTYEFVNVDSRLLAGLAAPYSGLQQLRPAGDRTRWVLTEGPSYLLTNAADGECMDVFGSSVTPGATVGGYLCHGNANQRWQALRNPNGSLSLRSESSGLCLAVADGSLAAGAPLVQVECGIDRSLRWNVRRRAPARLPATSTHTSTRTSTDTGGRTAR